jgi:hypothetical protein
MRRNTRRNILSVGAITGIVAAASAAHGAAIASYNFSPAFLPATTVAANATASSVTLGTSVSAPIQTNDFYSTAPVMTIARTNDTAAQAYLQVTVTAAAGYELNLDTFTFDGAKGGAATPRTYEAHSSVGGLAISSDPSTPGQVLASGSFAATRGAAGSAAVLPTITVDLSGAAYDHLSTLTMRLYFYTPTISQNIDLDNLIFNGEVVAVTVPEPATFAAGFALAGGAILRRRR